MKKTILGLVLAGGLMLTSVGVASAANQPDDAIKAHITQNGAFDYCNSTAITNGHVVFGNNSAINPLAGQASANADTDAGAIAPPQTASSCDLSASQRVEPAAWWPSP